MGFKPGQQKPVGSGRSKGSKNKRSEHLVDALESLNFNLPERLIHLLPKLSDEKQADVLLEMMSFIFPKRKATDIILTEKTSRAAEPMILTFVGTDGTRTNKLWTEEGLKEVECAESAHPE
jgi:hypothetical protein